MSICVVGINHKTADVAVREKVYFPFDKLSLYLRDLLQGACAREAVLLSTCNRSELYCQSDNIDAVFDWFCAQTSLTRQQLEPFVYKRLDQEAVAHIMEVACGLDSMVLGESQILGQMKAAFSESCTVSAVDALFHRLFQQVFSVAKEIRSATAIGACPVSVASAAVHFVQQNHPHLNQANVVLIGAGEMTELLIRYLQKVSMLSSLSIVNRSVDKATQLVSSWGGRVYALDELHEALTHADVVFSATGLATPLVTKEIVAQVLPRRHHKPLIFIDIGVPRNVDPAVAELAHTQLYCIDDLKVIIEKNRQGREHAAVKARELIYKESMAFMSSVHSFDKVSNTIRAYRRQIEAICREELIKAKQNLRAGMNPHDALDAFAYAFTKKLLHSPSVQLRQAGAEGKLELLRLATQLFSIPDAEVTER